MTHTGAAAAVQSFLPPPRAAAHRPEPALSFAALLERRRIALRLPRPDARLQVSVVVPVRNEEASLPRLVEALAAQVTLDGLPFAPGVVEVILLLNNCTDRSAKVARALKRRHATLRLHVAEVGLDADEAHVGRARQALFDTAYDRFSSLGRHRGLILTTDADTRPEPGWIAWTQAEFARGVCGVAGRILLEPAERAAFAPGVRRLFLLDTGYRHALEELRALYAPVAVDPFPVHHQHFGGSLAVTAAAYARAGGMPLVRSLEDVALYRAVVDAGGAFRHSFRVRVYTSARIAGRAQGGLADTLGWWHGHASASAPLLVESAAHAHARTMQLGLWCAAHPGQPAPWPLAASPHPPPPGQAAEVHETLRDLRVRIAALRPVPLGERLRQAARFVADRPPLLQPKSRAGRFS